MRYLSDKPSHIKLKEIIAQRGISGRTLSKLMYGQKTHREILKEIEDNGDIYISKMVKLCNTLDISIDELLTTADDGNLPTVVGNNNVVNSLVQNDVTSMRAEIKLLKSLIEEKEKRINDKDKQITELGRRLDFVLNAKLGQKSDTNL